MFIDVIPNSKATLEDIDKKYEEITECYNYAMDLYNDCNSQELLSEALQDSAYGLLEIIKDILKMILRYIVKMIDYMLTFLNDKSTFIIKYKDKIMDKPIMGEVIDKPTYNYTLDNLLTYQKSGIYELRMISMNFPDPYVLEGGKFNEKAYKKDLEKDTFHKTNIRDYSDYAWNEFRDGGKQIQVTVTKKSLEEMFDVIEENEYYIEQLREIRSLYEEELRVVSSTLENDSEFSEGMLQFMDKYNINKEQAKIQINAALNKVARVNREHLSNILVVYKEKYIAMREQYEWTAEVLTSIILDKKDIFK